MGRINPNDAEKYDNRGNSSWFSLKNHGDVATVQFMYDTYDDLDIFLTHKVKIDGKERHVNCLRNYGDPIDVCPFCAAGMQAKSSMFVSMYNHDTQEVNIWERGKQFRKTLESLFNRYSPLSDYVFEIERNGAKGDQKTQYTVFPTNNQPYDLSEIQKPEFIGSVILDKTAEDMDHYLAYGEFEEKDNRENNYQSENNMPRRGSRVNEPVSRRSAPRNGGSRRGEVL